MLAVFDGGPANGLTLQVRGTTAFITVLGGKAVEYPTEPDQEILRAADDVGWTEYAADADMTGVMVRFAPVPGR